MAETVQAPGKIKTYLDDWTEDLSAAAKALGLGSLTITAIDSVTADGGAAITAEQLYGGGTGVTFKLDSTGVAAGNITVTVNVTLSNGDTDQRSHLIEIRST